jgi:hypothetical protein
MNPRELDETALLEQLDSAYRHVSSTPAPSREALELLEQLELEALRRHDLTLTPEAITAFTRQR